MATQTDFFSWQDADRRILRAAIATSLAGIVVKLVATAKEFVVAGAFGRTDAMDAFLAAAVIPGLLINLIAESMNQALIPTFVRVRETKGKRESQELLARAMFWMCAMLIAASVLMALCARFYFPLIASHFGEAKLRLAERMFYGMLPIILVTGIASNCAAVLNTAGRFALPAVAPVMVPLAVIISIPTLSFRLGIWTMVYATVAGSIVYAAWTLRMMRRQGYTFQLSWKGWDDASREVVGQYGPVLLSSVVASGGLLVDQSMAAALPAGSLSALAYANRFVSVVVTLLAGAVASAVTPAFSSMVAQQDWDACERSIRNWGVLLAAVTIPVTVVLIFGAHGLIRLTFQHGVFNAQDTQIVASVLSMYALQIPFIVGSRVHYRFLLAMRRTDLIFYCGSLNLSLDIVLNVLLMRIFGVAGIALATSAWSVSTWIFLWYWTRKLLSAQPGAGE